MNIRHKFFCSYNGFIPEYQALCKEDYCIYCGFIVDKNIEDMFVNLCEHRDLDDDVEDDFKFIYKCVNEKYHCLTEEEFAIKNILE